MRDRNHPAPLVIPRPEIVRSRVADMMTRIANLPKNERDQRALREIAPLDTVVFARYHDQPPSPYSYDDSSQEGDPAEAERRSAK